MKIYDVIIIGSGPAGVHAAWSLIEAGLEVAIVDTNGSTINPQVKSNIQITQSFSKGGLSNIWPGMCDYFSEKELQEIGLPNLENEYLEVSKKVNLKKS